MRFTLIFQCLLVASLITVSTGIGIDLLLGAATGLAKGIINGSIGAFAPLAKKGLSSMLHYFGNKSPSSVNAANHAISEIVPMQKQDMGNVGSTFSTILQSWMSLMQKFLSSGGSLSSSLFGKLKSGFENFFKTFGGLNKSVQGQVGNMYSQTSKTFNNAMKLKLNPAKNHKQISQEMQAAKKVMETSYPSHRHFINALKHNAPQLTAATQHAFNRASEEYKKHYSSLNSEATKGVEQMHSHLVQAKFSIGDLLGPLGSLMGQGQDAVGGGFSTFFNIVKNMFNMLSGLF